MGTLLHIITADKRTFHVEFEVGQQSQTIRNMLEDLDIQQDGDGENILPLTNEDITGPIFKKALIWMEKNRGKTDFQRDYNEMNEWEKEYVNMPVSQMFPILIAGNFLEIEGLIDLMTSALALQIQNNDVVEIRKIFDIEDPQWTPEELQKLKEENAWAFEQKSK